MPPCGPSVELPMGAAKRVRRVPKLVRRAHAGAARGVPEWKRRAHVGAALWAFGGAPHVATKA
eukprot:4369858-Pyramimonas_sp.AAC.1